jgi:anaerobic selenocysteine-containing dehydrogenase
VVLPAATFAESPLPPEGGRGAQLALMPPDHEAWPDWKVIFELARSLGLGRYFPWTSWEEAERAPRRPYRENPLRQPGFETSQARYGTPSGKIELASELLARHGQDALPVWRPPSVSPTPEFPLLLVSGPRTGAYINSQFRRVARVRLKIPEPRVRVHPDAARAAGIADGERVKVISPLGWVEMRLVVTTDVHPELAVADAGWEEANVNLLQDASRLDPISGFPAFRSGVCRLERAKASPLRG